MVVFFFFCFAFGGLLTRLCRPRFHLHARLRGCQTCSVRAVHSPSRSAGAVRQLSVRTGLSLAFQLDSAGAAVAELRGCVTRSAASGPAAAAPSRTRTGRGSCPQLPVPGGCTAWRPAPGPARAPAPLLQRSGMRRTHRGAFAAGFGWHTASGPGRTIGALWPAAPRAPAHPTPSRPGYRRHLPLRAGWAAGGAARTEGAPTNRRASGRRGWRGLAAPRCGRGLPLAPLGRPLPPGCAFQTARGGEAAGAAP